MDFQGRLFSIANQHYAHSSTHAFCHLVLTDDPKDGDLQVPALSCTDGGPSDHGDGTFLVFGIEYSGAANDRPAREQISDTLIVAVRSAEVSHPTPMHLSPEPPRRIR